MVSLRLKVAINILVQAAIYVVVFLSIYLKTGSALWAGLGALCIGLAQPFHEYWHYRAASRKARGFGLSPMGPFVVVEYSRKVLLAPVVASIVLTLMGFGLVAVLLVLDPRAIMVCLLPIMVGIISLSGSLVDVIFSILPKDWAVKIEELVILRWAVFIDLAARRIIHGEELRQLSRSID